MKIHSVWNVWRLHCQSHVASHKLSRPSEEPRTFGAPLQTNLKHCQQQPQPRHEIAKAHLGLENNGLVGSAANLNRIVRCILWQFQVPSSDIVSKGASEDTRGVAMQDGVSNERKLEVTTRTPGCSPRIQESTNWLLEVLRPT